MPGGWRAARQQGEVVMLVLSRRLGEEIVIGDNIHIVVLAVLGEKVRIGIRAPAAVRVDRLEVHERRTPPGANPEAPNR
jgi:carbon storage regulator